MFFIVGLTTRTTTVGSRMFYCPNEGGSRVYRHLRTRRWITLFFLPLIPLGQRGELVQCQSCGAAYDPDIVQRSGAIDQG